jgi:hypothetical protein
MDNTLKKQYFKGWSSYLIPRKPSDPINYEDTANLASFYLGIYNEKNQLIKFIKYYKEVTDFGDHKVGKIRQGNATQYFMIKDSKIGENILYVQTEGLDSYLSGEVNEDNSSINMKYIKIVILFIDEYEYWPNNIIKERIQKKDGGIDIHTEYDVHGNEISRKQGR